MKDIEKIVVNAIREAGDLPKSLWERNKTRTLKQLESENNEDVKRLVLMMIESIEQSRKGRH